MRAKADRETRMASEGLGGGYLRPDERRDYGTDEAAASDARPVPPVRSVTTWVIVALVLLGAFAGILALSALWPLS